MGEAEVEKDVLIDETTKAITNAINQARKDTENSLLGTIQGLKEEVASLSAMVYNDKSLPEYEKAFIARYQESIDNLENRTKKRFEKLDESAFVIAGGLMQSTVEEDKFFQLAARDKVRYSPFIRNIRNIIVSAALSGNIKVDIPHEETDQAVEKILASNKFSQKLKSWIANEFVDGEIFIPMFMRQDGTTKFRWLDPQEIMDIEHHPNDNEVILSFVRQFNSNGSTNIKNYPHVDYYEQLEDEVDGVSSKFQLESEPLVFYFKYGYRPEDRGELPLIPILRYDRIYEDVLIDAARLYHERSRVLWIRRLIGSNQQTGFSRTDLPTKGGVVKVETDYLRWRVEPSHLSDHVNREYGRIFRLAIAAGVGLPEYLIFEDSSNQSYASLRSANNPFYLTIGYIQSHWVDNIKELVRVVLRELVKRNILPEEVEIERLPIQEAYNIIAEVTKAMDMKDSNLLQEAKNKVDITKREKITTKTIDLPVAVMFPKPVSDQPLLQAQALSILRQAGIISKRTSMKILGLDPQTEILLLKYEEPKEIPSKSTVGGKTELPQTNLDRKIARGQ